MEMDLISPGGEKLLHCLELGQVPLELRRGLQGPPFVASGKASLHASCQEASQDSCPVDVGA